MSFDTAFERSRKPNSIVTDDKDKAAELVESVFGKQGSSPVYQTAGRLIEQLTENIAAMLTITRLEAAKSAREETLKESAEFFCHWLLRAYEAIHRDTSYEEGENLDSIAREINQVIGFAGYEPESAERARLLTKQFAWNGLHVEAAANRAAGGEGDG